MSEQDDNKPKDSKGDSQRAPLTLKPRLGGSVSTGTVKQSFSHGRSKTVVVETKRRVAGTPPAAGAHTPRATAETNLARPNAPRPATPTATPQAAASGSNLRDAELEKRRLALAENERRAAEARARADADAKRRAEAEAAQKAAAAAAAPAPTPSVEKAPEPTAKPEPVAAAPVEVAAQPEARLNERKPMKSDNLPNFGQRIRAPEAKRPERTHERSGDRPQGDRPHGDRPHGERHQGDRPHGDRRPDNRGPNDRGPRPDRGPDNRGPRPDRGPNDRGPRPDRGPNDRGPRPDRGPNDRGPRDGTRPEGARPPREGETVRYSANSPRPPRLNPALAAAPATPEVARLRSNRGDTASKVLDARRNIDDDEALADNRKKGAANLKAVSRTKGEPKRREGRLTLQDVVGDDEDAAERMRSLASVRRAREREREKRKGQNVEQARMAREVVIPDVITVQELSNRMAVRAVDIIKFLMKQGMMLKMNDVIETDIAELVATEFGHTVKRVSESDVEVGFIDADDHDDDTMPRPPVVAVMGHVDHGKTSLLDALRKTDVAAGESGGITQHIGAYQVRLADGQKVTFLDTPGHAAFSAMRARGANATDIVVLVVAADDGVMPQTIEAINHARAAKTPLIVAINKMDKPGAKPQNIINELLQHEIVGESLGGDVQMVEVSAKTGMGLDNLIESLLLQAEVMDLRANPDRTAEGVIVESKLDKGRGAVATMLVKRGTLKRGDIIVAGSSWGRVRALINEREEQLLEAGPSEPVEILGLNEAPDPGETFAVVENEARAREITDFRQRQRRDKAVHPSHAVSLTDMMSKLADKKAKEVQIIVKADVQGSAEAIQASLEKLSTDEVRARIIHSQAGAITESDVQLAKSAGAPIIGFNVRAVKQARDLAEREGVEIRYYSIIYDLIDDIKGVMSGMLSPTIRETFLGNAEILEIFDISKIGKVAGCRVTEGRVQKGARTRIIRDNVVIQEMGVLHTLKRFKDDVNEVVVGQECGMSFKDFQDIKKGDLIECFTVEEIKRSL